MSPPWIEALQTSDSVLALAFACVFGLIHRALRRKGFKIAFPWESTDIRAMMTVGLLSTFWTLLALFAAVSPREQGSPKTYCSMTHDLSNVPWISTVFFAFWLTDLSTQNLYKERRRTSDEQCGWWKLNCANGPFDWTGSLEPWFRQLLFLIAAVIVVPLNMGSFYCGHFLKSVTGPASLLLFYFSVFARNSYYKSPHRYSGSMLRVALPTSHAEGTVYVLPSRRAGFQAVWSPKIEAEHIEADQNMMTLFATMRAGNWNVSEPLRMLRLTMAAYRAKVDISDQALVDLAEWLLLEPGGAINKLPILGSRPPGIHLIGRDLMYALCHAEYLVFMAKQRLPPHLQKKSWIIRQMQRSGGSDSANPQSAIGFKNGIQGYTEAVKYIYALFSENIDEEALSPSFTAPKYSSALGIEPESTAQYVDLLWTLCVEHNESTFSALYMFCCTVFIEVGNAAGYHIFPIRCISHQGDMVSAQIIWRQGWYECMQAQFIASSPVLAAAYAAGLW